jgi:peptidoglycan biosynthesis protein MviN/MurJ (putative lipid II flippase)
MLVVAGVAAAVGVVIAREFGRGAQTDGLLAAYGVFIVIVIGAQAIRIAVLPDLARARAAGRLASELAGFALALAAIIVPIVLIAELATSWLATLLTGADSGVAHDTSAEVLRWVVPAACANLFAGLAASGLAALDDYALAALGYAAGSIAGLTLILLRVETDGTIAVAWGMTLNASIALAVPLLGLYVRSVRARMPRGAVVPTGPPFRARLGTFVVGAALPLGLQLLYVVCLAFASRQGLGAATSFVYAYVGASALVTATAGSLGLVTSVPLSRSNIDAASTARHIVAASWLSLALVGAACGVFALAGGDVVETFLGGAYGGEVGAELGRLVVLLAPWILASVAISLAFPLAFVTGRTRALPWIGLAALVVQVPLAWLGAELFDLEGLAIALGITTVVACAALLQQLRVLGEVAPGLSAAALTIGGIATAAFVPAALLLGSAAAAALGVAAYVVVLALVRPRGLSDGWHYLRALG